MELVQHHCRNCGGALHPYAEDKLKCQNCGSVYDVESAQKHTKQMRELFDEAKQELINNLRRNLYNAVNAEYVSSVEVQGFCTSLKQYLPDDFQANFYEIATGTNVRRISQAIREIDVAANYDDLDGVISYLIRSLQFFNQRIQTGGHCGIQTRHRLVQQQQFFGGAHRTCQ